MEPLQENRMNSLGRVDRVRAGFLYRSRDDPSFHLIGQKMDLGVVFGYRLGVGWILCDEGRLEAITSS